MQVAGKACLRGPPQRHSAVPRPVLSGQYKQIEKQRNKTMLLCFFSNWWRTYGEWALTAMPETVSGLQ